ncbi:hypothetical protein [Stenotrophomonas geniculata]|uniref:hypothetical protein n=1 Tax=Stenotrophomonas geniculata TaxID=86188 RepID=UPI002E77D055|nr:hypothetical protein [Stenotrophomonas geniculata]
MDSQFIQPEVILVHRSLADSVALSQDESSFGTGATMTLADMEGLHMEELELIPVRLVDDDCHADTADPYASSVPPGMRTTAIARVPITKSGISSAYWHWPLQHWRLQHWSRTSPLQGTKHASTLRSSRSSAWQRPSLAILA